MDGPQLGQPHRIERNQTVRRTQVIRGELLREAAKILDRYYRQHYYQEAQVARLIGYLYLQEPGQAFTDDQLSTVNWAVF